MTCFHLTRKSLNSSVSLVEQTVREIYFSSQFVSTILTIVQFCLFSGLSPLFQMKPISESQKGRFFEGPFSDAEVSDDRGGARDGPGDGVGVHQQPKAAAHAPDDPIDPHQAERAAAQQREGRG